MTQSKKVALLQYVVFSMGLVVLTSVLLLLYLLYIPSFTPFWIVVSSVYYVLAVLWQSALYVGVFTVCCIPFFFLPTLWKRIAISLLAGSALTLLVVDIAVFSIYRFHINKTMLDMAIFHSAIELPLSLYVLVVLAVSVFTFCMYRVQTIIARYINVNSQNSLFTKKIIKSSILILCSCFICFILANGMYIFAKGLNWHAVRMIATYIPLHYPLRAQTLLYKIGIISKREYEEADDKHIVFNNQNIVKYPLQPIASSNIQKPLNFVVILVDTLRYDAFSAETTPNMWKFIQKNNGVFLQNHYSSGNMTQYGIFGMLYGLSSTYWDSFLDSDVPPVLIKRLQDMQYNIKILFSAKVTYPPFHRTVFMSIPNLHNTLGATPDVRDRIITDQLKKFLKAKDEKSFFAFILYDSVHGYIYPKGYKAPFSNEQRIDMGTFKLYNDNPIPVINQYRTAAHYVDSLVGEILDVLESQNLLDSTVVVLSSDHGEEFNDNKQGTWLHGSNLTPVQTHVPFAIVLPKVLQDKNKLLEAWNTAGVKTNHIDFAPTILQTFLGVENPLEDYTTGVNLFAGVQKRPFFVLKGFNPGSLFAIVDDNNTSYEFNTWGFWTVRDSHNVLIQDAKPNKAYVEETLHIIKKFLR